MTTLGEQLRQFLHSDWVWHSKGRLTADMTWKHLRGKHAGKRYLPDTVSRALRLLEEQSVIAVKDEGISVAYKWIPPEKRKFYIPHTQRPDHAKQILFKP